MDGGEERMNSKAFVEKRKYDSLYRKFLKSQKLLSEIISVQIDLDNAMLDLDIHGYAPIVRREIDKSLLTLSELSNKVESQLRRWNTRD